MDRHLQSQRGEAPPVRGNSKDAYDRIALGRTEMREIEARYLRPHPTAQRGLPARRLKQIKEELDLDVIGVLHAVEYPIDGVPGLWIVDGQTRLTALMESDLGSWKVEVMVHLDALTDARASQLFLFLNNRTNINPYDRYANELQAGSVPAVHMTQIVQSHGLKVSDAHRDGHIAAPVALRSAYALDRGVSLDDALGMIVAAWGDRNEAMDGKLIEGISHFIHRYGRQRIDIQALTQKLSKYKGGPSGLLGDAKGQRRYGASTLVAAITNQVVAVYNLGRRTNSQLGLTGKGT